VNLVSLKNFLKSNLSKSSNNFGSIAVSGRWNQARDIARIPAVAESAAMKINLTTLLDDGKCYRLIRQTRWPNGFVESQDVRWLNAARMTLKPIVNVISARLLDSTLMIWLTPSLADINNPYANGLVVWIWWTEPISEQIAQKSWIWQGWCLSDDDATAPLWTTTHRCSCRGMCDEVCTSLPDTRDNPKSWKKKRREGTASKGFESWHSRKESHPSGMSQQGGAWSSMLENVQQVMIKWSLSWLGWGVWSMEDLWQYQGVKTWTRSGLT